MNKKVLRWNYVFQYGWVITNVINSLLLLPFYFNYIDKSTLGVWLAASGILSWMTLSDPGVGEVLQQTIAEIRGKVSHTKSLQETSENPVTEEVNFFEENQEIGRSIGSGFIASSIILFLSVIVGLVCFFLAGTIIDKDLSAYPNLATALLITIISTGMSLVSFTVSGINQGLHNSAHVAISSLTANFLFLIVNLVFLFMHFGVMSIALANLFRALYINIFNFISLSSFLKKEGIEIKYQKVHFKKFIRIFSFTSASKIIGGIAGGIDTLVLARFIPPAMITLFETNKRPINQSNTLIGRHSVALMPLISHAKGTGNKPFIVDLIQKQFKLNVYIGLYAAFMFLINYKDLLTLWVGKDSFLGYPVLILLATYSVTGLVAYFMNNINYALGEIKNNSAFYIVKNVIYGVLVFFASKQYGIIGALTTALVMSVVSDFWYFGYRIAKMGYMDVPVMKKSIYIWIINVLLSTLVSWGCLEFINRMVPESMHLSKMLIGSALFTLFYLALVLITDKEIWGMAISFKNKLLYNPIARKVKSSFSVRKSAAQKSEVL